MVRIAVVLVLLASSPAAASTAAVEWDPSVLVLRGFSAVGVVGFDSAPRWRFGVDVFTFRFPSSSLEDDWRARAWGGSLLARFRAWRGLWIAGMVRASRWGYTYEPSAADTTVSGLELHARLGYDWYPFDGRLYVAAQLGVAVPLPVDDRPVVGDQVHRRLSPYPTPALHVGWAF